MKENATPLPEGIQQKAFTMVTLLLVRTAPHGCPELLDRIAQSQGIGRISTAIGNTIEVTCNGSNCRLKENCIYPDGATLEIK